MKHSISLALAVAVVLTGCSAANKSATWQKVIDNRADRVVTSEEEKAGYADHLHKVLAADQIEHKVVTYQYRYKTQLREEAIASGTAVIYRDSADPQYPWWIMDERSSYPVWLPNDDLESQLQFFLRRKADVLAQQEYPGDVTKSPVVVAPPPAPAVAPMAPAAPQIAKTRKRSKLFSEKPAPMVAKVKTAPVVKPAPAREITPEPQSAPRVVTRTEKTTPLITRIFPAVRPARFASDVERTPLPRTSRLETQLDEVFHSVHGTKFDPSSNTDRQKMAQLRNRQSRNL